MAWRMASEAEVREFLARFIAAMDVHGLDLWNTAKNDAFVLETGFTQDDAELVIRMLRSVDYSKGPEDDDDPRRPHGEVWVFSREFEGFPMYIKLKLELQPYHNPVPSICMSFHEEERPMVRPHWPPR